MTRTTELNGIVARLTVCSPVARIYAVYAQIVARVNSSHAIPGEMTGLTLILLMACGALLRMCAGALSMAEFEV